MPRTACYPVLAVEDVAAAADHACTWFGFRPTYTSSWYVSLVDDRGAELAFVRHDHETVPEAYRSPAAGVLLNLEVTDVDAEWERLVVGGGLEVLRSLRTEEFGQRHFILAAPGGLMVDVITPVPATGEHADAYLGPV